MRYVLILIFLQFCFHLNAQERIKMEKSDGIYKIPCQVNGLRMKFYFDTGASLVNISLKEALFMLENDYLSKTDILGSGMSSIADGSIVENTIVNLRELKIGNIVLHDVKASVSQSLCAPILLGQSALKKLGVYKIEGDYLVLFSNPQRVVGEDVLREQAISAFDKGAWIVAEHAYEKLYEQGCCSNADILSYAKCCHNSDKPEKVVELLSKVDDDNFDTDSMIIAKYTLLGYAYGSIGDEHNCLLYSQLISVKGMEKESLIPKLGIISFYFVNEDWRKALSLCNECLLKMYDNTYENLSSYYGGKDYNQDYLVFAKYFAMFKLAAETSDEEYVISNLRKIIELSRKSNSRAKDLVSQEGLYEVFKPCYDCNGTGTCHWCNGRGRRYGDNCSFCNGLGACRYCHGTKGQYTVERR